MSRTLNAERRQRSGDPSDGGEAFDRFGEDLGRAREVEPREATALRAEGHSWDESHLRRFQRTSARVVSPRQFPEVEPGEITRMRLPEYDVRQMLDEENVEARSIRLDRVEYARQPFLTEFKSRRAGDAAEEARALHDFDRKRRRPSRHGVVRRDDEGALESGEVPRLARRVRRDPVPSRRLRYGEERGERRIRVCQRGMDLVAQDRDVIAFGQFGNGAKVVGAVHQSEWIVWIAQEEGAGAIGERPLDAVEVEAEAAAVMVDQRHLDDPPSGFGNQVEERRIDRWIDDDAFARPDDEAQGFDDHDADVGGRHDAVGIDRPAPAALGEPTESALCFIARADVARVRSFHRRHQGVGDRLGQWIVHLGDEERKHVGPVDSPALGPGRAID